MKNTLLGLSLVATSFALSACSTVPEESRMTQAASTKIGSKTAMNDQGEEITCKRDYATGSRVKYTEICGTAEEWDRIEDANRKFLKDATGERAFSPSK